MSLEIVDLTVRYGPILAVDSVSLTVEKGQIVSLIGPNGAGKSSFVRGTMGAVPSTGTVRLDGVQPRRTRAHAMVRRGVSYVPDGRGVFPGLTVREHIALAAGKDWAGRWDFLTEIFPILAEKAGALGSELSGGQQQALSIARALAPEPDYIVLDEPSIGLSPVALRSVVEAVGVLARSSDVGILLAEQNAAIALELSDVVHVMVGGRVVRSGASDELNDTEVLRSLYMGDTVELEEGGA